MIPVASAEVTSPAPPGAPFVRWADGDTWPRGNTDTVQVLLERPFANAATGRLEPRGRPVVRFVLASVVPRREFVDTSMLPEARLVFPQTVRSRPAGGCVVRIARTRDGPLARVWNALLGKGFRTNARADREYLLAAAQRVRPAA